MANFYCSVLLPPKRLVSREKFDALCMWDAFLQVSHKYKPLNRFDPLYKVEYCGRYKYFNIYGQEIK